jgi:hypothetical protein
MEVAAEPRRLLLRLPFPTDEPMVVEVEGIERDFLERVWKLMLNLREDQRNGAWSRKGHHRGYPYNDVAIVSKPPIERLLATARARSGVSSKAPGFRGIYLSVILGVG